MSILFNNRINARGNLAMRILIVLASSTAILCSFSLSAYAFRCGEYNQLLATEGMHKYQILKDCGPPDIKEDVGVDNRHGSYRIVEEWIYIMEENNKDQMYIIKFDSNGVSKSIEWLGEKN